jgi:pimeloyl-ACP methyl ester carboxylesterase
MQPHVLPHTDIPLQEVLIAPPLRIRFAPGASSRLVVSLAGVGQARKLEPPPEFFRLSGADGTNPVLFISDESRSWLNAAGMAGAITDAIRTTSARVGATEIVAIGNSMGGTMALHLARLTPINTVIAFVPQFSADPQIVPQEQRWLFFRRQIAVFPYHTIDQWPKNTKVFALHGGTEDEMYHARRFPKAGRNIQHFVLPGHDHNLARRLHDQGALAGLVAAMMDGKMWQVRRMLETMGAVLPGAFATPEQKVLP